MITQFIRRPLTSVRRHQVDRHGGQRKCPSCGNLNLEVIHQHGLTLDCRLCGRPCPPMQEIRPEREAAQVKQAERKADVGGGAHWKVLRRNARGEPYLHEL